MKAKILSLIVIVAILIGGYYGVKYYYRPSSSVTAPVMKAHVALAPVTKQNIPLKVYALGSIIAPQTIMLKAKQPGVITKVYFKSGQRVKKGQLLMLIDDTQEIADLRQAQADYLAKKLNYQRSLSVRTTISGVQLTTDKGALDAAEALVVQKKSALADTRVIAPFSGVVGRFQPMSSGDASLAASNSTQVALGAYVQIGSPLVILSNPNHIVVQYSVPQQYSAMLKLHQKVSLTTTAYPKRVFSGKVTYISPVLDLVTQAFTVRATLNNIDLKLLSGMSGYVTQVLQTHRYVLAVPSLSARPSLTGHSVYKVEKGMAKAVPVVLGQRFGRWVEVKSGLKRGEQIIVTGMQQVYPGTKVVVEKK